MDLKLKDKVVIVTGAARGIGRAISLSFAREQATVVVTDIDLNEAETVAAKAREMGVNAAALKTDVTRIDEVRQMVEQVLSRFGKVDVLVNNAGVVYSTDDKLVVRKQFHETVPEDWPAEINTTLFGVLNCTNTVLRPMIEQKSGSIINIVSDAGRHYSPRVAIYGAGKGGIIGLTRNVAHEVGRLGVRVNCISPGIVKATRMERIEDGTFKDPVAIENVKKLEKVVKETVPVGRMGIPQDIADITVFIASDLSSYIVGQTISVNGGRFMP